MRFESHSASSGSWCPAHPWHCTLQALRPDAGLRQLGVKVFRENTSSSNRGFTCASIDAASLPQITGPAALSSCIMSGLLSQGCFSVVTLGLLEEACVI